MWKILLATIGLFFLVFIGKFYYTAGYNNTVSVLKESLVLATTVKPEPFTELYFENHLNLPKAIILPEKYNFTFTLHNLEYQDTDYTYSVYLTNGDKKIILDEGNLQLKHQEYKSIRENFGPLKPARIKVTVELINKNQQISFWMY